MLFHMTNVNKWYGNNHVLKDISFGIEGSEIVCIIGPSGCGKTTLLNIISGITIPEKGETIRLMKNISNVFQEDRLLPWKTVYENIKIVDRNCSKAACMEMINRVGLAGFENHFPSELSGGMRQRVSMARGFLYPAELLLMDEPLKSLDYMLRLDMIHYILQLWSSTEKSIVFVTHEIDEAVLIADRIIVLSERPAEIRHEFRIEREKEQRDLTNSELVTIRNDIIKILENQVCC